MSSPTESGETVLPTGSLIWIKYDYKCSKMKENLRSSGGHFSTIESDNPNDPIFIIIKDIVFDNDSSNIISNLEEYYDNEFNSIRSLPIRTHICDNNIVFISGEDLLKIQQI